ncbi:hypothetical protein J421_0890 [Gemmatirosa kalamazoonensis]|uniref:Uncharacterized protein n=1 Tax=Gemmatirosa kalamazoonensis TaxID=861299 RepID=W0RDA9_9BACT|nr:hypothetical protein [Gemmatirosa kalamazoonensis]AHG88427.1 hypothetical protein J421_0890 [Gemmatirosa kalamazoonensis]
MTPAGSWLLVSLPVALVAIGLLVRVALSLVRATRAAVVVRVPVRAEQRVTFERGGALSLNLEASDLARARVGLRFSLTAADGSEVLLRPAVAPITVSSFMRARMELMRLTLPSPGAYVLRVDGADPRDGNDAIVFTRPLGASLVRHVVALIAVGALLVGSLVVSGLALLGGSRAAAPRTLEATIAEAAAVVRARTVGSGAPRFQVLETLAGAVPAHVAGAGRAEGLVLDTRAAEASGYRAMDGQEVIVLLAPVPPATADAPASVRVGEPLALLPIVDGRVVFLPNDPVGRRSLTLEELRRLSAR